MMWFPLVLFGVLQLGGAAILLLAGGQGVGVYWIVAGPLGGVATGVYSAWRGMRIGVDIAWAPYLATGVLIVVGTVAAGGVGAVTGVDALAVAGPAIVVSLGMLNFARLERSPALAVLALSLALAVVALLGIDMEPAVKGVIGSGAYGLAFLGLGLATLIQGRQAE